MFLRMKHALSIELAAIEQRLFLGKD